jgi:hypothetical protein
MISVRTRKPAVPRKPKSSSIEAAQRRAEVVAELAELLESDDLVALLNVADIQADPTDYLCRKLGELRRDDTDDETMNSIDVLAQQGWSIVERFVNDRDAKTRQLKPRSTGWVLSRTDEHGRSWFAGQTLTWSPLVNLSPGFASAEEARAAGLRLAQRADEQAAEQAATASVVDVTITVPLAGGPTPYPRPLRLTHAMAEQLGAVLNGLRERDIEHAGRPIATPTDALAWLLEQVTAHLR